MNIGNKIYELRKKKNLSQEELAEKLNVTRQTISKWELNETSPDLKQSALLSKELGISLDELVDNDIKDVLIEKVSNTEKLAGILIKIIKGFGVILIGYILLVIIAFLVFTIYKKQPETSLVKEETLYCSIDTNDYVISIGSDSYFNCSNCDKQMQVYLKDITDWSNLDQSIENINTYFEDNGGSCSVKE